MGSGKQVSALLLSASITSAAGATTSGSQLTDAEKVEVLRSVRQTLEMQVQTLTSENTELQRKLQGINSLIREMDASLPSEIKRPPLLDADGKITESGKQWLRDIFPREIGEISQEMALLKTRHGSEIAEQIQEIMHKTLLILAFLTLLATACVSGYLVLRGISAYKKVKKIGDRIFPPPEITQNAREDIGMIMEETI